jgi:hypothetical protein
MISLIRRYLSEENSPFVRTYRAYLLGVLLGRPSCFSDGFGIARNNNNNAAPTATTHMPNFALSN